MHILFALQSPDYLRFYDSAIRELAARGHRITLAVTKTSRGPKEVRLEDFEEPEAGISQAGRLPKRWDVWSAFVHGLRGTMDFIRYLDPAYSDAPVLRARMKRKVLPRFLHPLDAIPSLSRGKVQAGLRALAGIEAAVPVDPKMKRYLEKHDPDLVLVTPLIDAASTLVDVVRAAHSLGIPAAACIASWDNLTNKGHLKVQPDGVIVWNELQKREAVQLHRIPEDKVIVTGAQVFDRWFAREPTLDRSRFCEKVGLSSDRPFVLFVGSSSFISKIGDDVELVRRWIETLRNSDHPAVRNVGVLYRPHPYYYEHWADVDLSDLGDAAVWPRDYGSIMDRDNREHYFNTLHHSSAVVGINTSAMIEAAILGKPVHSILLEEFSGTQEGTLHFRYLLPENGGFLWVARSLEEHVEQLERTLTGRWNEARGREFVQMFLRPRGIDRDCTPILVEEIERLGTRSRPRVERGVGLRVLAAILFPLALTGKILQAARKGKSLSRKTIFGS